MKTASKTAQSVALNDYEKKMMRFKGGISACNLFQCENKDSAIAFIHERFQQIVHANPWLKGSCSKGKNGEINLNFDSSDTDATSLIFSSRVPSGLDENSSYTDIINVCEPYIVKTAFKLYRKKNRLTKLVILHLDDQRFLLIFSLSHLIGDGHTFYQIFNMLSSQSEVYGLNVIRKSEMVQAKDFIPKKHLNFIFSPTMIFWLIIKVLFSRKKVRVDSFELNKSYVQQQKQAAKEGGVVPFVSTNDILSSTYAHLSDSNAMMLAINFRNRIPAITDKDAGNYEDILVIDKERSSTNEKIRTLINDLKNEVPKIKFPKGRAVLKSNPVFITNWAGFSKPIIIENAQSLIHLPLYTTKQINFDLCVVYSPRVDVVSALFFMKGLDEDKVRSHPLFKKSRVDNHTKLRK